MTSKKKKQAKSYREPPGNREGAIRLVESWLADESGYDMRVWPLLSSAIERNRLSDRSRLGG